MASCNTQPPPQQAQLPDHRVSRWLLVQNDDNGDYGGVRIGLYGGAQENLLRPQVTDELVVPVVAIDSIISGWKGAIDYVTNDAATVLRAQKDSSSMTTWLQSTCDFLKQSGGFRLINLEDLMQVWYDNPNLREKGPRIDDGDDNARVHPSLNIWNLLPCTDPNQGDIVKELQTLAKEYDIEDDLWSIARFCQAKQPPPYDFQNDISALDKFSTYTATFDRTTMAFEPNGLQLAQQATIPTTY